MTENTNPTGTPRDGMAGAFDRFLEHQRRSLEETGRAFDALVPPAFKEHAQTAGDEFRKGLKVLVDATIDELEKMTKREEVEKPLDDETPPPSTTGRTKVKVQVE